MPELSNKTLPGGEMKELTFLDTPIMSTYLVAFCVGEFDYVQAQTTHGVLVRVYTPPGKSETGLFALDCATKSLDAYNDFFGIKYPLPKLDIHRCLLFAHRWRFPSLRPGLWKIGGLLLIER
jgi:puromycin-sensitive aminopeptidase